MPFSRKLLLIVAVFQVCVSPLLADPHPDTRERLLHGRTLIQVLQENLALQERVERLEKTVAALEAKVTGAAAPSPIKGAGKPKPANVESKFGVNVYGYVKLDAISDNSTVNQPGNLPGNFVFFVPSEAAKRNDGKFYLTANQSRIGFDLHGPIDGKAVSGGRLEWDFYGAYLKTATNARTNVAPENQALPMLRHAYAQIDWPSLELSLLGGQTWDVISPLGPNNLGYTPMISLGNIGYRRPQVRLTKGFSLGSTSKLTAQVAATRTIGKNDLLTSTDTAGDGGIDSGRPTFQGRLAVNFPGIRGKATEIGISGHEGREEYDYTAAGDSKTVDSRSTGIDARIPLHDKIVLQGEAWEGKNLDNYYGGILQGLVVSTRDRANGKIYNQVNLASGTLGASVDLLGVSPIRAKGGWFELGFGPFHRWQFFLGMGRDHAFSDLLVATSRTRNESRWFNTVYDLTSAAQVALEWSRYVTTYKSVPDGSSSRLQFSLLYKF